MMSVVDQYFSMFGKRDLDGVCNLLSEDVVLHDMSQRPIFGRNDVRAFCRELFSNNDLELRVLNKWNQNEMNSYAVEFEILITPLLNEAPAISVGGVDCIQVINNKICSIRAYTNLKHKEN